MDTVRAARRELALVFALAISGIAVALLVAFVPWYEPAVAGGGSAAVVQTYSSSGAGAAVAPAS